MGRPAERVSLRDGERKALEALARRSREERSVAFRARIVLRCAEGLVDTDVARLLRTSHTTVGTWRRRFNARRLDGLLDEPRPGAPRRIDDAKIELVVRTTLESLPKDATHWSTRELARKLGMSHSAVARVWRAFGLRPHRAETFALSKDPLLVDKVRDIVGLYLSPPANALVLCVDEKSQIQALERSQPVIPMTIGQVELRTHDYVRHGTTTLFAALDVATGNVVGSCKPRHRSEEFLAFLREVDRATPEALDLHLVLDNYATHKTQAVRDWLLRHPRFRLHFTPTHGSWLNQVERWFALLSQRRIKRGSHTSVEGLEADIASFIDAHNESPKPFRWVKGADEILASIARFATRTRKLAEVPKEITDTGD